MKRFAFALGLLALFLFAVPAVAENDLWCRFFDVGKADAALLVLPDGARIMIDAGTNKAGKTLAQRFRRSGIDTIDLLIITHFDKDHVGGADKILEACTVRQVLMPQYAKESKQHQQFMEALAASPKTKAVSMSAGETLSFAFHGVALSVTAAHETWYGRDEENDFSLAARFVYGDTRFFFTGDAEDPRQRELLEEGDVACDVLKVPYHGKAVACSAAFLSACHPQIAWIPDSDEEPAYPELVRFLSEDLDCAVYRSADEADLTVLSDGEKVWVEE